MIRFIHPAARAATAAATLLGAIALANPLFAATGDLFQGSAPQSRIAKSWRRLLPRR
jgi:hypothetical protein